MNKICFKESLYGKSGVKIIGQAIHNHRAFDGIANECRDITDKKAISDLYKKRSPEDAQLFKDKLFTKKHAKDYIDSEHCKFFS